MGLKAVVLNSVNTAVATDSALGYWALYPRDLFGVTDFLVGDKNVVLASKNFLNATVVTADLTSPLDVVVLYAPRQPNP